MDESPTTKEMISESKKRLIRFRLHWYADRDLIVYLRTLSRVDRHLLLMEAFQLPFPSNIQGGRFVQFGNALPEHVVAKCEWYVEDERDALLRGILRELIAHGRQGDKIVGPRLVPLSTSARPVMEGSSAEESLDGVEQTLSQFGIEWSKG